MVLLPQPEEPQAAGLPVGSACRVCVLADCRARQEPSVMVAGV
ncbi:hypothetical protein [Mangrovicoccus ximenensis]|nr:hypothetical protein [Mangrovicoccus ximenensis]